jgi:hypothetical protein
MDYSLLLIVVFCVAAFLFILVLGSEYDAYLHPEPGIVCGKLYKLDNEHTYQLVCGWTEVR